MSAVAHLMTAPCHALSSIHGVGESCVRLDILHKLHNGRDEMFGDTSADSAESRACVGIQYRPGVDQLRTEQRRLGRLAALGTRAVVLRSRRLGRRLGRDISSGRRQEACVAQGRSRAQGELGMHHLVRVRLRVRSRAREG